MGKILDNPEEYFSSLTDEEFLKLLDEMGVEYKDIEESEKNE